MFIAPNSYIDYERIIKYYPLLVEDMNEWLKTHTPEKDSVGVYDNRYGDGWVEQPKNLEEQLHKDDWKSIPVYFERKWNMEVFKKSWENLSTLRGVYQVMINFIAPNGKITSHKDHGGWGKIREDFNRDDIEGYSLIATVQTGMINLEEKTVGTECNGVVKYPLQHQWHCFDGYNKDHSIWNYTNTWRISAVFDIDKKYFNEEYITTSKDVCDKSYKL